MNLNKLETVIKLLSVLDEHKHEDKIVQISN